MMFNFVLLSFSNTFLVYLTLSIVLSGYLGIAFKLFDKYGVDNFQAIVFNYIVCVITGSVFSGSFPIHTSTIAEPWFKWAIAMGALFITIFNVISFTSIKSGITVAQTANKLSLVIPVLVSIKLYNENISALKIIGIVIALVAVYLVSKKEGTGVASTSSNSIGAMVLPVLLFVGSGIIDTLTKYVQKTYLYNNEVSNSYLISGFFFAGVFGTLLLAYLYIKGSKKFAWKHVFAGIILGVPNYFSIYFFVKSLDAMNEQSSSVIPINNIGVLFFASIIGIFIFKEKMSKQNYVGLFLTLVAILCIYFAN